MRASLSLSLLASLALAVAAAAQHRETNPFSSHEAFEEGLLLYRLNCGVCHGMQGDTGRGARLAVKDHRHGNTDAELFRVIQNGVSGTEMPGSRLDEDELWKILLVVRSFEENAGVACEAAPGDAQKGREVYASNACHACHVVAGEGGRLGPELTYVGYNYSREQLRRALVDPGRDVDRLYRQVRVVTEDETVHGVLRNEDAYSIQLMDRGEKLRSFLKDEVLEIEKPAGSWMPSYAGLKDQEMDDLLSYLCSLQGEKK